MAIVGALPVQLANGTLADATQVMSDFNYVVSQVNGNAAGLGQANNFTGGAQTISGDVITTNTASQTLTNKTLTTPIIGAITGNTTITGPNGTGNSALTVQGGTTTGDRGVDIRGGTGGTDFSLILRNASGAATLMTVDGNGSIRSSPGGTLAFNVDASTGNSAFGTGGAISSVKLAIGGANAAATDSIIWLSNINSASQLRWTYNNAGAATLGIGSDASGNMIFGKSASNTGTSPTTFLSLNQTTGAATIPAGGLSVTGGTTTDTLNSSGLITASGGVAFTGGTLSNYVTKTSFTPVLTGIGAPAYTTQTGEYERVGNHIKFRCTLVYTGGTNATGITGITGLPTSSAAAIHPLTLMLNLNNSSFTWVGAPVAWMNGSATIQIGIQTTGSNVANVLNPNAGTKDLYIAGEYFL